MVEGLPYFGMLIQTMGPKGFDYDALLEEHDTDALVLNFGAVLGRRLFISVPQDVVQVLLEQGEALQQTLPGALLPHCWCCCSGSVSLLDSVPSSTPQCSCFYTPLEDLITFGACLGFIMGCFMAVLLVGIAFNTAPSPPL